MYTAARILARPRHAVQGSEGCCPGILRSTVRYCRHHRGRYHDPDSTLSRSSTSAVRAPSPCPLRCQRESLCVRSAILKVRLTTERYLPRLSNRPARGIRSKAARWMIRTPLRYVTNIRIRKAAPCHRRLQQAQWKLLLSRSLCTCSRAKPSQSRRLTLRSLYRYLRSSTLRRCSIRASHQTCDNLELAHSPRKCRICALVYPRAPRRLQLHIAAHRHMRSLRRLRARRPRLNLMPDMTARR